MIKWIISDMDGTLLVNDHDLPGDFPEIMAALKKEEIMFSPASGRQLQTLAETFKDYQDDLLIISENGTYVSKAGKEVFSVTLPEDIVKRILARVEKMDQVFPIVSCKNMAYYNSRNPMFLKELNTYYKANTYVESFAEIDCRQVLKIALCDAVHRNARKDVMEPIMAEFGNCKDIQIVLSGEIWTDINPSQINKGEAILQLQKQLGIKPEECMAFGDYLNDLEMMKAVEHSYAMANAVPEIKAVAKYIAPANKENGVTKVIKAMLNNKKEPLI